MSPQRAETLPADDHAERVLMIRNTAAAVAPRDKGLKRIRALRFQMPGFDRATWREICSMGWSGLLVAEADGGSGMGMTEFCALTEELGRALLPEPLIQCATIAPLLPARPRAELLAGTTVILPAWQERPNSLAVAGDTRLVKGRITGRKLFVPMAAGADVFLVSTNNGLTLVAKGAPGLTLETVATQDGGHFGTLSFRDTPAEAVPGDLALAFDRATLAHAAYLLGVMTAAFDIALDYIKLRRQFDQPIGAFQAVQHRAADMKIQIDLTQASVGDAARTLDRGARPALRQAVVSRAKARAAEAGLYVAKEAIQLHGAIGYTDECDVGLYLRKAMTLANLHGSAALHRARFAAVLPDDEDD